MYHTISKPKQQNVEMPFVSAKISGVNKTQHPQPHVISRDVRNSSCAPCAHKSEDNVVYDHPKQAW